METKFENWIEETSTKTKEEQLLNYLSVLGQNDRESKKFVDMYLFDTDNIPIDVSRQDVEALFDDLGIDIEGFLEFIEDHEYDD